MRVVLFVVCLAVLSACPAPGACDGGECSGDASSGGGGGTSIDSGTGGGTTGDAGSEWERYCSSHRREYCRTLQRCGLFASAMVCESSLTEFDCGVTPPGIADGRVRFDGAAAATCLAGLDAIACGALTFTECPGVLTGLGVADALCFGSDRECGANLYCDSSMTCPGRCKASAAIGATPTPGQSCVQGAYVYEGKCVAYAAVGASCAADRECVESAFCNLTTTLCEAKHAVGEACGGYGQCLGVLKCQAGRCGSLANVNTACNETTFCMNDLRCGDAGTCLSRGGGGAACTPETDECTLEFFCNSENTCEHYRDEGQPCTVTGGECGLSGSLYCTADFTSDGGVCAKARPPGEACAAPFECVTGLCSNGMCVGCIDSTP